MVEIVYVEIARMKLFKFRNMAIISLVLAGTIIFIYGCTNFRPLVLRFRQERGEAIAFQTKAFSATVKGYHRPPNPKGIIAVYLNFHNIEIREKSIVLDTSTIIIKCNSPFAYKWMGISSYHHSNKGRIVLEDSASNYPQYFQLEFLMMCDTLQLQRAIKDSVKCLVTLPMATDPIQIKFTDLEYLKELTAQSR